MLGTWDRDSWKAPVPWWVVPLCGLFIAAAFARDDFQLVQTSVVDWLLPGLAGVTVLGAFARRLWSMKPDGQRTRLLVVVTLVGGWVAYFVYVAVLCLNGFLDSSSPATYTGVVASARCGRVNTWTIVGAPTIPTAANTMLLEGPLDCHRIIGDSVRLQVRAGFFRRPWVASYTLERPDPVKAALAHHRALVDSLAHRRARSDSTR
jgi:hypothetical protein